MDKSKFQSYMIGILVGFILAVVVYATAHIDNGFLFFLAAWPSVIGVYWLGLVGINLLIKEDG